MKSTGLYVHIPFCAVKCRFCHFAAFPGRRPDIPRYVKALERDLSRFSGAHLGTIFFGGGTPSLLEEGHWEEIFDGLRRHFTLMEAAEITVECNPESVTPGKLSLWRRSGVNRLSFGLQARQDFLLKGLGRLHDWEGFLQAFHAARAAGFDNLNVDLMYGLPGQTQAHWRETLEDVLALAPEHLSAYALTVEERTAFGHQGVETDDDLQADMYEALADRAAGDGLEHYEISNFARAGRRCRHNLRYWLNQDCLGAGVSAAWYQDGVRRKNTDNLSDYLEAIEQDRSPVIEETILSEGERVGEDLMLGLRLKEGVAVTPLARRYFGAVLDHFRSEGFLEGRDFTRLTRKGWLLSNRLFQDLLTPQPL